MCRLTECQSTNKTFSICFFLPTQANHIDLADKIGAHKWIAGFRSKWLIQWPIQVSGPGNVALSEHLIFDFFHAICTRALTSLPCRFCQPKWNYINYRKRMNAFFCETMDLGRKHCSFFFIWVKSKKKIMVCKLCWCPIRGILSKFNYVLFRNHVEIGS